MVNVVKRSVKRVNEKRVDGVDFNGFIFGAFITFPVPFCDVSPALFTTIEKI